MCVYVCDITHSYKDVTHSYVRHDSFVCVTWLIDGMSALLGAWWLRSCVLLRWQVGVYVCDMTHPCVCHDLFHVKYDSFRRATWLIHVCAMTRQSDTHVIGGFVDMVVYATGRQAGVHVCDMTHPYLWHDSFIYETWLIHMCDVTHSYVSHDSFMLHIWMSHVSSMNSLTPFTACYLFRGKINFFMLILTKSPPLAGGGPRFTTQAMSWRSAFCTYIINSNWNGFETGSKLATTQSNRFCRQISMEIPCFFSSNQVRPASQIVTVKKLPLNGHTGSYVYRLL